MSLLRRLAFLKKPVSICHDFAVNRKAALVSDYVSGEQCPFVPEIGATIRKTQTTVLKYELMIPKSVVMVTLIRSDGP